jgi:hypothetical protein
MSSASALKWAWREPVRLSLEQVRVAWWSGERAVGIQGNRSGGLLRVAPKVSDGNALRMRLLSWKSIVTNTKTR